MNKLEIVGLEDEYDQAELEKMVEWAMEEAMIQKIESPQQVVKFIKAVNNLTYLGVKIR
jgi:hypothetical protein